MVTIFSSLLLDFKPVMWHNNYIRSEMLKNYRAKEMGFYKLDVNKEYSSTSNRYFTIYQLHLLGNNSTENYQKLKTYLQNAIEISNVLNRSLVIPPIHCQTINSSFCNICAFSSISCFYNILQKETLSFKESVLS